MTPDAYLDRIGYRGRRAPDPETLRRIHRAHLLSVPFENLDIPLGRPIELNVPAFYDKIVRRGRGGFCYELNGLFAWLLEQLGFPVVLLSARVFQDETPGPEFDHLLLEVDAGGNDGGWIADVGFGDSFLEPLPLRGEPRPERGRSYRLLEEDGARTLQRRERSPDWVSQYVFGRVPRRLDDFDEMCRFQQTSPESSFTRRSVCSKATPTGRITLAGGRLIVTRDGRREERPVEDPGEYAALLAKHFGIAVEPDEASRLHSVPG